MPSTCQLSCPFQVATLLDTVHSAVRCLSNPEVVCRRRGGEMRGERRREDVIAFIDTHEVIHERGEIYPCTLCRKDCDILSESISTLSKQLLKITSSISCTNYSNSEAFKEALTLSYVHVLGMSYIHVHEVTYCAASFHVKSFSFPSCIVSNFESTPWQKHSHVLLSKDQSQISGP